MKTKLLSAVFLLAWIPLQANAQYVPQAPVGSWQGMGPNGRTAYNVQFTSDGMFYGQSSRPQTVSGRYQWDPTTGGGFLTVYTNNRRTGNLFYSVTYFNDDTFLMTDTTGSVRFHRR